MRDAGVKPEIEVFDLGQLRQANDLIERDLIAPPPWIQLCLGIRWGIEGTLRALVDMCDRLPAGAHWSAWLQDRYSSLTTHALLMGGHVRVGFEDNIYLSRGVKADSNAQFVERTVRLARELQREVATCDEARDLLGLHREKTC